MTVATKHKHHTLEQIRDILIKYSQYNHKDMSTIQLVERNAYNNAILDFYNEVKKQREAMDREAGDYKI